MNTEAKRDLPKQIAKEFTVLKEAPEGIEKQQTPEGGLWAFATVETPDTVGDIVRVDGVSTDPYHNPPKRYLKILAQHMKSLPDGTPAVIGRVEEFAKTQVMVGDEMCKALAFRMSWATDGGGKITPLAQAYKDLFDGGYLDSFSVGMMVKEADAFDDGGFDLLQTSLHEISAVSIPANAEANAIQIIQRALDLEAKKEVAPEDKTVIAPVVVEPRATEDQTLVLMQAISDQLKAISDHLNTYNPSTIVEGCSKVITDATARIEKSIDTLSDRLDFVESALVVKSEEKVHSTDDRIPEPATDLSKLKQALDGLKDFLER